jgi:hypothetical protein
LTTKFGAGLNHAGHRHRGIGGRYCRSASRPLMSVCPKADLRPPAEHGGRSGCSQAHFIFYSLVRSGRARSLDQVRPANHHRCIRRCHHGNKRESGEHTRCRRLPPIGWLIPERISPNDLIQFAPTRRETTVATLAAMPPLVVPARADMLCPFWHGRVGP